MIAAEPPDVPGGLGAPEPAGAPEPSRLAGSVARIVELLTAAPARVRDTRVLAIDGRSGAGKTTLSLAVQQALDPPPPIVHLEAFYLGWDGLRDGVARLLEWVLVPLAEGGPSRYRRYDWGTAGYAEWIDVPAAPVLIVEGVGAGSLALAPYLSLLVYLDSAERVRFRRAMARDGETYRPNWQRWAHQEEQLLADDDPHGRADLIIDTQQPGVV